LKNSNSKCEMSAYAAATHTKSNKFFETSYIILHCSLLQYVFFKKKKNFSILVHILCLKSRSYYFYMKIFFFYCFSPGVHCSGHHFFQFSQFFFYFHTLEKSKYQVDKNGNTLDNTQYYVTSMVGYWFFISPYKANINAVFCMTIFYIPNPTQ